MAYTTLLYDLDNTLYPPDSGVWEEIGKRIDLYIHNLLRVPREEIPGLRHSLYLKYGTSLRGLQILYQVDPVEYLTFVHDIPLHNLLKPDPRVHQAIRRYPQRRAIFTNADRAHARRVLEVLELSDCFSEIIDILDIAPYCKPMPEAFEVVLQRLGVSSSAECILIDDTPSNLKAARELGFYTVMVGSNGCPSSDYHAGIRSIADLPSALDPIL